MTPLRKILLLAVAFMATVAYGQDTLQVRIMTYNMRFGERASIEDFAAFIKQQAPDFVALQEVDCRNSRNDTPQHNGSDFIADLAQQTGMFGLYGKAINFAGGYYGIGILSKYQYIEVKKTMLPNPKGNEQRVLLEASFELPHDTLTMACTHLDYEYPTVIEEQTAFLCQHFEYHDSPTIIAGDFNTTRSSKQKTRLHFHRPAPQLECGKCQYHTNTSFRPFAHNLQSDSCKTVIRVHSVEPLMHIFANRKEIF